MSVEIIRRVIELAVSQPEPVSREQFAQIVSGLEPPRLSMIYALLHWADSIGMTLGLGVSADIESIEDTPAHNDYLIYMWMLTKSPEWLNRLHSNLDSHVTAVGASALWSTESLREQSPWFRAAWDRIPLCAVQTAYRKSVTAKQN